MVTDPQIQMSNAKPWYEQRIADLERQLADCAVILYERYAAQAQDNCSLRDRLEAAEAKVARLEDVIWQRGA